MIGPPVIATTQNPAMPGNNNISNSCSHHSNSRNNYSNQSNFIHARNNLPPPQSQHQPPLPPPPSQRCERTIVSDSRIVYPAHHHTNAIVAPAAAAAAANANSAAGLVVMPPPTSSHGVSLSSHVYNNGLLRSLFSDTILSVSAPRFTRVYHLHALVLSKEPFFLGRLLLAAKAVLPVTTGTASASAVDAVQANCSGSNNTVVVTMPSSPALALAAADTNSATTCGGESERGSANSAANVGAASVGYEKCGGSASAEVLRGRDYLWKIECSLPEYSTEEAFSIALAHIYSNALPTIQYPASAVSIVVVASHLGLDQLAQHALYFISETLNISTLPIYLPLLGTRHAGLVIQHLGSMLQQPELDEARVRLFAQLPWALLKDLFEGTHPDVPEEVQVHAAHERYEFAKRVIACCGHPNATVVMSFQSSGSGLKLVRRGEKRGPRKMWKIDQ